MWWASVSTDGRRKSNSLLILWSDHAGCSLNSVHVTSWLYHTPTAGVLLSDVCGCCVSVQCENVDNMSVIWSNVGWHRDKSTGHCTVCVGPGSCRVSPIHFLSRWHKRPRNQALVSFGFACAWLFLVCVFLVVVMLSFAPVEWLAGRVVSEMIIWSAELDIKLHSTDSLTCWLLSVNMMMMI